MHVWSPINCSKFGDAAVRRSAVLGNLAERGAVLDVEVGDDLVVPADTGRVEAARQTADDDHSSTVETTYEASHALVAGRVVVDHRRVAELRLNRRLHPDHLTTDAAALELGRHDQAAFATARLAAAHVPRPADCHERHQLCSRTQTQRQQIIFFLRTIIHKSQPDSLTALTFRRFGLITRPSSEEAGTQF